MKIRRYVECCLRSEPSFFWTPPSGRYDFPTDRCKTRGGHYLEYRIKRENIGTTMNQILRPRVKWTKENKDDLRF